MINQYLPSYISSVSKKPTAHAFILDDEEKHFYSDLMSNALAGVMKMKGVELCMFVVSAMQGGRHSFGLNY